MPPKKKKKVDTIKDKLSCINNLLLESINLVKNKNITVRKKINNTNEKLALEEIDLFLNRIICDKIKYISKNYKNNMSFEEIKYYLDKIVCFTNKNKDYLHKINLYSTFINCTYEALICLLRNQNSFLSKKIDHINVSFDSIFNEIIRCFKKDIEFYDKMVILEEESEDKNKYNELKNIIVVIKNILNKIGVLNKDKTLDEIRIIKKIITDEFNKKKFNKIVSGIYNWNVIVKNINGYIMAIQPFDIYNINQKYEPFEILEEICKLLNEEKNVLSEKVNKSKKNLDEYKAKLDSLKLTNKYKLDKKYNYNCNFIHKRNDELYRLTTKNLNNNTEEIKRATNDLINIKNTNNSDEQMEILYKLNYFLLDNHKLIDEENPHLNLETLQNKILCKDYLNTFSEKINWIEVCQSIKNYFYFRNAKKMCSLEKYKVIKCSLKSIIKDDEIIHKLNTEVIKINEIVTRSYLFIKHYTLFLRKNNMQLMDVTDFDFISMAMRTVCINDKKGANMSDSNKELLEKLEKFYVDEFKNVYAVKCDAIGLSQILNFAKVQMKTAYTNNIIMNYQKYLKSYLISIFSENKKMEFEKLKTKKERKGLTKDIIHNVIICLSDIFCGYVSGTFEKMKSNGEYKKWITENKNRFLPTHIDFSEKGLENELEKNPTVFFEKMINMCEELEKLKRRLFSCFPLRTSLVPSNIDLDTMSLITLFITAKKENNNDEKIEDEKQGISKLLKDNLIIFRDRIWSKIINLNKKQFKWNKNYEFDHHIQTDGITATILFAHKDLKGIDLKAKKDNNKDFYKYVDKLGEKEVECEKVNDENQMKEEIKRIIEIYNVVMLDPGKNPDLLYMCNYEEDRKKIKYMKYTTKQRINEMQTIKHREIIKEYKEEHSICEEEKKLSEYSNKTCDFEKFKKYMAIKCNVDLKIKGLYEKEFIRKLKLRTHINKLRSESKLVNNIKKIFGSDKRKIIIMYGDWSRTTQMRGIISTPCIGLKRRLSEDFKIMNINEFRTSCLDNLTFEKNINAKVKVKKKGKEGEPEKEIEKSLHAVLVSDIHKTANGKTLKRFQNRNRNSVLNMVNIIEYYKMNGLRHPSFSRTKESPKGRYNDGNECQNKDILGGENTCEPISFKEHLNFQLI